MSAQNTLQTNAEVMKALEEIKAIANEPRPGHANLSHVRIEMGLVHCWLLNYLQSVYEGAEKCAGDEKNFIQYARFGVKEVERHHALEEELWFPYMQKRGVKGLEENIAEHAVMHAHLETLVAYLDPFLSNPPTADLGTFSPTHLQHLLDQLFVSLVPHLRHELDTLSLQKLEPFLNKQDLDEMNAMVTQRMKSYPPDEILPGAMINCPPGVPNFPPFPFIVKRVLIPLQFSRKHKGCWKYGKFPEMLNLF